MRLNNRAIRTLPPGVAVPRYDRSKVTPGVLHIGVGNFHRAHQATYLDQLFNLGVDLDWGIVGAGVLSSDRRMRECLQAQDWLTTTVELAPGGYTAAVRGAMVDFVPLAPKAIIDALARPDIRIVSLTITEGGYFLDAATGQFRADHPNIIHDIETPDTPRTAFGTLLAGLRRRREAGLKPFTIVSCDNIPENGRVARQTVLGLAQGQSDELADWVASELVCPNSMVDCITPATGGRECALVEDLFGIEDAAPVVCEPFRQWVIEDHFTAGRPELERVGVEFVSDVTAYELMKLRILNGGHAAIAYVGAMLGHHYVHDAIRDPLIKAYLERLERQEIIPSLPQISGVDFEAYLTSVLDRFANPMIGDTLQRLCSDGSNRQPKFILPTISDRLDAGQPIDGLALEVALWCKHCAGGAVDGPRSEVTDERAERLTTLANQSREDSTAFLSMHDVFGPIARRPNFVDAFSRALRSLWSAGIHQTLQAYLNGNPILIR